MEKFTSVGPDWQRAGSSPAPRHTLDQSPQRRAEPTNATKPLATTVLIPLIWVSLAPSVCGRSAAMVASSSVTWRSKASRVASSAASRAGLPAVAAGCGGRLSPARFRIRAATVTFS
jgi:hypothetical protein